ncbi:hypothetical protein RQP46_001803 [Phenoliferia psychrophenolica]
MLRAALNLALSPFRQRQDPEEQHGSSPLSSIAASASEDDAASSDSDSDTPAQSPLKRPRRASTLPEPPLSKGKGKTRASLGGGSGPVRALPTPSPTSASDGSKGKGKAQLPVKATFKRASDVVAAGPSPAKKAKNARADERKVFLVAGLYYNKPNLGKPNRRASAPLPGFGAPKPFPGARKSLGGRQPHPLSVHPTGAPLLPLPLHFGATVFTQEREFRLPFDIRRDFTHDTDRSAGGSVPNAVKEEIERREQSRKPEPYKRIARNVYHERKPDRADAPHVCECKPPADDDDEPGCGEHCFNRMMQYCCSPKSCPCGDKCTNLSLGKLEGIPEGKDGLRVIWTGNRGFGLKTMVPLTKGQFIMEYRGEIISRDESYRRVLTSYKDAKSYYFLDYDGDEVVDAGQQGNSSRFINHSCGPNVKVVRWSLSDVDEYQMGIFAKCDIAAGTELSYDYGWQDFSAIGEASGAASTSDPYRQRCFCGADVCTGWMGGKKDKKEKEKPLSPKKRGPKPKSRTAASEEEEEASVAATWSKPAHGAKKKVGGSTAKKAGNPAGGAKGKGKGKEVIEDDSDDDAPPKASGSKASNVKVARSKIEQGNARSASKVASGSKLVGRKTASRVAQVILAKAKPKLAPISPSSRARFAKDGAAHATRGAIAKNVRTKIQIVKILP